MEYVRLLLVHGTDITTIGEDGKTALHYATMNRHVDVIAFVLEKIFDIDCGDSDDYSSLHHAAERGVPEGREFLLKGGADIHKKSRNNGHTPMSLVMLKSSNSDNFYSKAQVVQVLLEYGAEMDNKLPIMICKLSRIKGVLQEVLLKVCRRLSV